MAGNFNFAFSGDDIDLEDEEMNDGPALIYEAGQNASNESPDAGVSPPVLHSIENLLSSLAPHTIPLTSTNIPLSGSSNSITLPHRASFDIRMSLMASKSPPSSPLLRGTDLVPGSYEGGWQVWEGCIDLVRFLDSVADEYLSKPLSYAGLHIIELGAGIALPTLYLFHRLLSLPLPTTPSPEKTYITVSDYNASVLELATIPAFLLVWAFHNEIIASCSPSSVANASTETSRAFPEDLEVTEELIARFTRDLRARNIVINAISGSWGPDFVRLVSQSVLRESQTVSTLVLASETIYAPGAIPIFTETLMSLLEEGHGKAFVAAKKHYFGVGGSVDDFVRSVVEKGGRAEDLTEDGLIIKEHWVRRCILQITKR